MQKHKVISLFSGTGGFDIGFKSAGFDIALSCDTMYESCETLRFNNKSQMVFGPPDYSGDVKELNAEIVEKLTGLKPGDISVMVGGPPCQPFSVAAAQRFFKDDDRFKRKGFECVEKGQLIFEYVRLIKILKPKAFVIENVPGILTIDNGQAINVILKSLKNSGYTISGPFIVDAKNFGVPQSRKRALIIGSLFKNKFIQLNETHGKIGNLFVKDYASVAQALLGFDFKLKNSEIRNHKEESLNRYKKLKFGGRDKLGRVDRLNPYLPSKTIIAGGSKGGGRSHLHPFQARTLSVRECARLQTFPDSYVFKGKIGRQFTQVGNAVPPLLAEFIASQIMHVYFGEKCRGKLSHSVSDIANEIAVDKLLKWSIETGKDLIYNDVNTNVKQLKIG